MTERQRGFTLVELVIVISLTALVGVLVLQVLQRPLEGALAQQRRAALVDAATLAQQRFMRDVREAVPNSLRVSADGLGLELLHFSQVARYLPNRRGSPLPVFASGTASNCLAPGNACDQLRLLDPAIDVSTVRWLVIYNIGAESAGVALAGSNVWAEASPGVITPSGSTLALAGGAASGESLLQLTPPSGSFRFTFASPQHRVYLADQVVGYRCSGGSLWRYTATTLSAAMPAAVPAGASRLAGDVGSCRFEYRRSAGTRVGLASLNLQLNRSGEIIQLHQQVHVDNVP